MKFSSFSCISMVMMVVSTASSMAQVQLSSLGRTQNLTSYVDSIAPDIVGTIFQTDAHAYQLNSLTLNMTEVAAGTIDFRLYAVFGGVPTGSPLFSSFTQPAIPAAYTYGDVTFTSTSTFLLSPSTAYALVLSTTGSGEWIWSGTYASNGYDNPAGNPWTFPDGFIHSHDGTSWATQPLIYMDISINATAIPEPSTYAAFAAVAALGLAIVCRRKVAA